MIQFTLDVHFARVNVFPLISKPYIFSENYLEKIYKGSGFLFSSPFPLIP